MVELEAVQASNLKVAGTFPSGLVAVFVGATAGIGSFTLVEFARCAPNSRIYLIGRSEEAGARITAEVEKLNLQGSCTFIKADVSLLKNVDEVCRQIKSKERSINLLVQSQGTFDLNSVTSEGLKSAVSLILYSRIRFAVNLLPELRAASASFARVLSIAAGSKEGPVDPTDFSMTRAFQSTLFSIVKLQGVVATMSSMALETLQLQNPEVSFIQDFPGPVNTNLVQGLTGWMLPLKYLSMLILAFTAIPAKEVGERHVFLATSRRFPAENFRDKGVELVDGVGIAQGTDGKEASGIYSVDEHQESAGPGVVQLLKRYKEDGTREKFWVFVEEKFVEITGNIAI